MSPSFGRLWMSVDVLGRRPRPERQCCVNSAILQSFRTNPQNGYPNTYPGLNWLPMDVTRRSSEFKLTPSADARVVNLA